MSETRMMRKAARIALTGIRAALSASPIKPAEHRAVEIYLLVTICNVNGPLAADVCGCTKQNVSKLLRAVEDRRENPELDAAIGRLEAIFGG